MQTQSSSSTIEETKIALNPTEALQDWLVAQLSTQLSLDASTIKVSEPLTRYGLDSIDAVTLVGILKSGWILNCRILCFGIILLLPKLLPIWSKILRWKMRSQILPQKPKSRLQP
jgi:acyl carrier protein